MIDANAYVFEFISCIYNLGTNQVLQLHWLKEILRIKYEIVPLYLFCINIPNSFRVTTEYSSAQMQG